MIKKWIKALLALIKERIGNRASKINALLDERYHHFESLFSDEQEGESKLTLNKVLYKIISIAIIFAGLLFTINLILITFTSKGGVFGDFLGGVLNPVLTFFTLCGLIATIVVQRQELRLARSEYEKTADALSTQAIETTFFNIIDLHHKIVDNLKADLDELSRRSQLERTISYSISTAGRAMSEGLENKESMVKGHAVFEEIFNYLSIDSKSPEDSMERYKYIQTHHNHILGHYFRNLYQALKVIEGYEENKLSKEQKKKYTSILRAQLSTKELALLFFNCIEGVSDSGEFKNLLIEFKMLEHLPVSKLDVGYSLSGSKTALANDDMFLQYRKELIIPVSLTKYYGGAFGKNTGVPNV